MRVFLTGATGFIGTAVAEELIGAGHTVLGVARTDEGARTLAGRGVEPHSGDLTDHASFIAGAKACDAVIHCAFIHDFSRFAENIEIEQQTVAAMLDALEGSGKPFVVSSGVALLAPGKVATENDKARRRAAARPRTWSATPPAAASAAPSSAWRRSPTRPAAGGFLSPLVAAAQEKGVAAYIGDGANRWPAGHRRDAARVYRLAVEKGEPGAAYHPIGDAGVATRDIAAAIGKRLGLPTASLSAEQAGDHFGWLGMFAGIDIPASSQITQQQLGWRPTRRAPHRGHRERPGAGRRQALGMSDPLTLRGQRVVVIGGTSGIGLAVAEAALADGAEVVVASSDAAKVEAAAAARLGDGARGEVVDVKDEASVAAFFERLGALDHLVFTAGDWGRT